MRLRKAECVLAAVLLLTSAAPARVVRVEVASRADVLAGKAWGNAGAYEKVRGRVFFAVDPRNAHNRPIVDLDKAPRNDQGDVEFFAEFYVIRPKDPAKGNGALLLEVPNRGGKSALRVINDAKGSPDPTSAEDFGDGFLLKRGFTIAWIGWQADVPEDPNSLHLFAPVARDGEKAIVGLVRADWIVPEKQSTHPLGHWIVGRIGGTGYPVSNPEDKRNVLTVRDSPMGERRIIPREQWQFAREENGRVVPSDRHVYMKQGFEPGKIYEIVYVAQDPVVVGTGLAAVRDFISHLKYDKDSLAPVKRAYAMGISQTGRFLRHFLWQDFNADEHNRMVLDGVIAHVAGAGRGSFNHRFAQPSRDAQPTSSLFYPTDLFPFTDVPQRDPVTGETAGLFDAPQASKTMPKVFLSNTSYEYWSRAASLIHTSPDGKQDVAPGENVRVYLFTGLQHFSLPFPPEPGKGDLASQNVQNPLPVNWFWRAMITNMDAWVRDGVEPPASAYPQVRERTLVPLRWLVFPKLPGVEVPKTTLGAYRIDYGPQWTQGIIDKEPPVVGKPFPTLVPQVDQDGNEVAGVRLPQLEAPLATYTGWNLRHPSIGMPQEKVSFLGSYIPFAVTASERQKTNDQRVAIAERYKTCGDYINRYRAAAEALAKQRWILAEDISAVLERGVREWDFATKGSQLKPCKPHAR